MSSTATHILCVEDNSACSISIRFFLEGEGFEITIASTGEIALELVRQTRFDLILMDVDLAGLCGFDICQFLKADPALRDIPVIFLSGYGAHEHWRRAREVGGVDYLVKPQDLPRLAGCVRAALGHQSDVNSSHAGMDVVDHCFSRDDHKPSTSRSLPRGRNSPLASKKPA